MGGTQSAPNVTPAPTLGPDSSLPSSHGKELSSAIASPTVSAESTDTQNALNERPKKPKPELSGWDLVQHKCRRKKKRFDDCWNSWYKGKFLTGSQLDRDCDDLFETWRGCVLKQMKKERERQGLGSPHKESILGDLDDDDVEDNKGTDVK